MHRQNFNFRALIGFQTASAGPPTDFKVVEDTLVKFEATDVIRSLCKTNNRMRNQHSLNISVLNVESLVRYCFNGGNLGLHYYCHYYCYIKYMVTADKHQ